MGQLVDHAVKHFNDFIEGVGHLALHPGPLHGQPDREVPFFQGGQGMQEASGVNAVFADRFVNNGHDVFSFEGR